MKRAVRRDAQSPARSVFGLAAVGCAFALALGGCSGSPSAAAAWPPNGTVYTLMQMNLCLSSFGSCYAKVEYPAVVQEAITKIRQVRPDAVTFSEACSGDIALIARQTDYYLRFSTVFYDGKPLPCRRPGGRGLFGDAVMSKAAILGSTGRPFEAQAGPERRAWLCAGTRTGVEICTAHLAAHDPDEKTANELQCAELAAILARRTARAVIFAGDVNRRPTCAPPGWWTLTDGSARQDPGSQQAYGTVALHSPTARVLAAVHTDHDVLVVRAYLFEH